MLSCVICGRKFNLITNTHLKTHNLTQAEYKEKYGEVASNEYKSVMTVYSTGRKMSPEAIEKSVVKRRGQKRSLEAIEKTASKIRGKPNYKHRGWQPSDETRQKMSIASKGRPSGMKGKKHTDDTRIKMSLADKGKPKSEEFKQNLRDYYAKPENKEKHSQEMTEYYKTHEHKGKEVLFEYAELRRQGVVPSGALGKKHTDEWFEETIPKIIKSNCARPNKKEKQVLILLNILFPNEWKYVGDGDTIIGHKNPDFININGKKQLIELFGDYWHRGENPEERIKHFKTYGYNTLVVWEKELKNELILKQKLQSFCGGV